MLGALSRSRARVASPRDLSRATKTIRAPIFASATAATSPIPDVPPVITIVFPLISLSLALTDVTSTVTAFTVLSGYLLAVFDDSPCWCGQILLLDVEA